MHQCIEGDALKKSQYNLTIMDEHQSAVALSKDEKDKLTRGESARLRVLRGFDLEDQKILIRKLETTDRAFPRLLSLVQIYRVSPQTMLPVLPKLASELQVDQESKRLAALELLGRLLSLPGSDLDLTYAELFQEFLKRACDQKVKL